MHLKREHVEWLSFIRYQADLAQAQANEPEPLNALSISTLHDAVESMLSLVGEALNAASSNKEFVKLFDAVKGHIELRGGDIAGHRSAMLALNNARVAFKHYGNQSSKRTVDRHVASGLNFLDAVAQQALDVDFAEVSLLAFVRDSQVRRHLERAESCSRGADEDLMDAFQWLRLAFELVVDGYQTSKSWYPGSSVISTKPRFVPSFFDIRECGRVAEGAYEWLGNLDEWVKVLVIGIDPREYTFFVAHTPTMMRTFGGATYFNWRPAPDLTEETFRRCLHFVLESAITVGRHDFTFNAWTAHQALPDDQGPIVGRRRVMYLDAPDDKPGGEETEPSRGM